LVEVDLGDLNNKQDEKLTDRANITKTHQR
jgi:hypothetical protein